MRNTTMTKTKTEATYSSSDTPEEDNMSIISGNSQPSNCHDWSSDSENEKHPSKCLTTQQKRKPQRKNVEHQQTANTRYNKTQHRIKNPVYIVETDSLDAIMSTLQDISKRLHRLEDKKDTKGCKAHNRS